MVTTILTDICRAFPRLTPEEIWSTKTESQMMAYYRAARRGENERAAQLAIVSRAAVATAIVNTIAGKDAPEFDRMVAALLDREGDENAVSAMPAGIAGIAPPQTSDLEGFTPL